MPTADCQKSGVEGKVLGLHSTVFSESDNENKPLNNKNQSKKAEKRPQLRKLGYCLRPIHLSETTIEFPGFCESKRTEVGTPSLQGRTMIHRGRQLTSVQPASDTATT